MKPFIILSYPRSGNTLCRFIIENYFNIRTYGYNSIIDISPLRYTLDGYREFDLDWIGFKRHNEIIDFGIYTPLIYIERKKEDAVDSHTRKELNVESNEFEKWDKNKFIYDNHHGKKIIINYEDLVNNLDSVIKRLSVFFTKIPYQVQLSEQEFRDQCFKLYTIENKSFLYEKSSGIGS